MDSGILENDENSEDAGVTESQDRTEVDGEGARAANTNFPENGKVGLAMGEAIGIDPSNYSKGEGNEVGAPGRVHSSDDPSGISAKEDEWMALRSSY